MSAPPGPLGVALRRRVLGLADTKRILGVRYSEWGSDAPSRKEGNVCTAMAEDEGRHAGILYELLTEWGEDPEKVQRTRGGEEYANMGVLDRPLEDWAEVVAIMFVADGALTVALEGLAEGSFEPARLAIPAIVAEEQAHAEQARNWIDGAISDGEDRRQSVRNHIARLLPSVGAWVWPDDPPAKDIIRATWDTDGEELWERWFERMREPLAALDLTMPEPDRKGWSEKRGREPGFPDQEAIARARDSAGAADVPSAS